MSSDTDHAFHDIGEIARRFPATSETILIDAYLTDTPEASARVFRIYHPLPPHWHRHCDEHLVLYSGEVVFQISDAPPRRIRPGQIVTFKREVVHAITEVVVEPAVFLTLDTPRRAADDVVFVDPSDADKRAFVANLDDLA